MWATRRGQRQSSAGRRLFQIGGHAATPHFAEPKAGEARRHTVGHVLEQRARAEVGYPEHFVLRIIDDLESTVAPPRRNGAAELFEVYATAQEVRCAFPGRHLSLLLGFGYDLLLEPLRVVGVVRR
jgi:hypothetical protein